MAARVQTADFDIGREIATLRANDARVGAVVTFIGAVRDLNDDAHVTQMTLEHYPGMTEKALDAIIAKAKARFNIYDALVVHRVGPLLPTDQIVLVAVTSAHRGEAFDGCRFIIDYLKTEAPFWKKEETPQGGRWVDARTSDDEARVRWEDRKEDVSKA
jgi:molybdopterin synthase catalytic subunit